MISRRRMFQRTVSQLAGIPQNVWEKRVRSDNWSYAEVCDIATVLNERVDVLLDVSETL